jgi:signal transduction histidine kinase
MKIREKLMLSVLASVVAVIAVSCWLSYSVSKEEMTEEIKLHAEAMLKAYAWELDSELAVLPIGAHAMAAAVSSLKPVDEGEVKELIRMALDIIPMAYGSTIAFAPGASPSGARLVAPYYFRTADGLEYKDLADPSYDYPEWDWYRIPIETKKHLWSEPYIDVGGGGIAMVTYSYPFYRRGDILGVATMDVDLHRLTDIVEKIVVGKTGRAFLLSRNGTFLIMGEKETKLEETIFQFAKGKPDEEKIVDIGKRMIAGESGFMEIESAALGKRGWVVFGPVPTTGWSLGILFPKEEFLGGLVSLHHKTLIISIVGIAAICLLIILISSKITRPIIRLAEAAKRIASGDLTVEPEGAEGRDEVGMLARSFGEMQRSLSDTLENLREETDMFTAAFSQMSDGMVILDPQWKPLQFNKTAERLLALPSEGDFREHVLAQFEPSIPVRNISETIDTTIHLELARRESEQLGALILSAVVTPILGDSSDLRELVMSVRDITDEKTESRSKANFLSLVSHKLKTPVTVLKSGTAIMQDGLLGEMSEKQKKHVDALTAQIGKLQALIDTLIGFSTIEGSSLEASKEEVELRPFWEEMSKDAERIHKERNPKIELNIAASAEKLSFNKKYLAIIFSQLLDNALKFNMSDPAEVKVDVRREEDMIVTDVVDNSVGIPPEFLDKIFDRFFQIEKYFTGNVEGMGLGLSYVKSIIEHFGGSIDVKSKPGEGSTFTVKIPVG